MEFIISSSFLLKSIQTLANVIKYNHSLTILNSLLFEVNGTILKITASDLETTITSYLQVNYTLNCKGAINYTLNSKGAFSAKILINLLKMLPEQQLTFSLNEKKKYLSIISNKGKYVLAIQEPEEFTNITGLEMPKNKLYLNADVLAKAINKTFFALSNDDLRPTLAGLLFILSTECVKFVSTDAHKLVEYIRFDIKSEKKFELILPRRSLQILKNLLFEGKFIMEFNSINASFYFGDISMICRLINGKYPDYEQIIPKYNNKTLIIERLKLLNSLKIADLFSNQNTNCVNFELSNNKLKITSEDDSYNRSKEQISCEYKGKKIKIGFNSKYIIDMLLHVQSEKIIFEMSDPKKACILKPYNGIHTSEKILMLLMPIII